MYFYMLLVLPDGPLSLEPVFEKPIPLQYDFGGPPPVKPAQSFHQPTPDVQQELVKLSLNLVSRISCPIVSMPLSQ